jgi:hypothetical protein
MPTGKFDRKQWMKVPKKFREALAGKTASPADELQWVMNNICLNLHNGIDPHSAPSLGAVRLLVEAKDDKGFKDFLQLWSRTIPPVVTKRDGFSDDGRHVFPLIEQIEKEFLDAERAATLDSTDRCPAEPQVSQASA